MNPHITVGQRVIRIALWAFSIAILAFLLAPLLAIIPLSFSSSAYLQYPIPSLTFRWYLDFLESADWRTAFRNTFFIGTSTAFFSMTLGTLAALGLSHERCPIKRTLTAFFISPMIVPVIILAVGTYFFFAPLGLTNGFVGIILAHTALAVPFVVVAVSATLSGLDRNLLRAAASLGAHPVRSFFKVVLPIVAPGVISGGLFAFATSLDEVVMILFLGGPGQNTVPRQMFDGIKYFSSPTLTAVATVLIGLSILLLVLVSLLRSLSRRYTTVTQ